MYEMSIYVPSQKQNVKAVDSECIPNQTVNSAFMWKITCNLDIVPRTEDLTQR